MTTSMQQREVGNIAGDCEIVVGGQCRCVLNRGLSVPKKRISQRHNSRRQLQTTIAPKIFPGSSTSSLTNPCCWSGGIRGNLTTKFQDKNVQMQLSLMEKWVQNYLVQNSLFPDHTFLIPCQIWSFC